ncbi:sigma-70 family RNA polymerase sigma factor, partial [Flavobacterium sp.]|uniref:RNA polymerase sigma factor n=1 Tax=Flavobacterium sp. TaxID=239 RepID=UPI00286B5232
MNQVEFINSVKPFKDKLFRLAKRLLISTEEAEDATQDVLIKLWNKNDTLNQFGSMEAYAMTITKNYCLDVLKSKRTSNLRIEHQNYVENGSSLQQKIEDENSIGWIEKIIETLPEQQKLI